MPYRGAGLILAIFMDCRQSEDAKHRWKDYKPSMKDNTTELGTTVLTFNPLSFAAIQRGRGLSDYGQEPISPRYNRPKPRAGSTLCVAGDIKEMLNSGSLLLNSSGVCQ